MPHRHCQCLTNFCRRHALYQVRWLSLLSSNFSLVPSTACLHVGQYSSMMSGSLTCVVEVVVVVVVKLSVAVPLSCVCCFVSVCMVPGRKGLSGHFCKLSSHLVLPFVRSLCCITHCFCCSFCVAALWELLVCDCMILVVSSASASDVSGMDIGSVTRCVVMPRCRRGCPSALPIRHLCWLGGHSALIILRTCCLKYWRLCPKLHFTSAGLPSCCGLGAGVVYPIIWYMMKSSIQVLPLIVLEVLLGWR